MSPRLELTGKVFGRLIVTGFDCVKKQETYWRCICDCGQEVSIRGHSLTRANTLSCGCFRKAVSAAICESFITHNEGYGTTPEYRSWSGMKARCLTKTNKDFHKYGGRGITICDRWSESYESFLADMGRKPTPQHSIDRRDNDGNYEPSNCRWATKKEQANNRKPKGTYNGNRR